MILKLHKISADLMSLKNFTKNSQIKRCREYTSK